MGIFSKKDKKGAQATTPTTTTTTASPAVADTAASHAQDDSLVTHLEPQLHNIKGTTRVVSDQEADDVNREAYNLEHTQHNQHQQQDQSYLNTQQPRTAATSVYTEDLGQHEQQQTGHHQASHEPEHIAAHHVMSADDALHREIEERARAQGTSATGFGTHGGEVAPMLAPATETDHAHNNGARDADVPGYDGDGHGPTGYPSDHKTGYPQEKGGYAGQASSAGLGAAGLGAGAGAVAVGTHLHGNDHDNVVNDDEGVGQVSRAVAGRSSHDIDPAQHQRDSSLFHPHEAPGRENAHVVPHEEYVNRFGGHDDGDHHDHHAGAIGTGAAAGTGAALLAAPSLRRRSTAEQRENDPASAAYAQEQAAAPQEVSPTHGGYAGVGAIGYGDNDHHAPTTRKSRGNLQPSRSYINSRPGSTYAAPQTQENGHINDVGFAKVGGGDALNRQPSYAGSQRTARTSRTQKTHTIPDHTGKGSAVAVQPPVVLEGSGYDQHNGALPSHQEDTVGESAQPLHQHDHEPTVMAPVVLQQQYPVESGRQPSIAPSRAATQINGPTESAGMAQSPTSQNLGPTTAVRSAAQPDYLQQPGVGRPISGGGLGAALATSGHKLTHTDKKALKGEIKTEKRFSKNLQSEAKAEAAEIISQMKQCKVSNRRAQKAARFQGAFRGNYETAIKNEVKAKQKLLKITNYYNKIAADLESATKEMEIRRNAYQAECQTRDADILRLEHLRKSKGTNDMEREARHGDSLTKQLQAKRALSMSSRRRSKI